MDTINPPNETLFYNKLLDLVHFIKDDILNCYVVLLSSSDRLDNGKAALTIKRLNSLLLDSSLDIINNSKIGHDFLGMHGKHLKEYVAAKLALNLLKNKVYS